eukprot:gnl/Spiro4/12183_TR6428_c0_g1_i1.p1 gnl/Spiro4/12183_TR6428_c0_g1~~gnl/Spiro4/12183_TR6428_c0_g1_i1.p1  ORF type:complete len:472 (+),score=73.72 gnl/Spiro4/12183_TR6428_c0_g1_i1:68-1417(+)
MLTDDPTPLPRNRRIYGFCPNEAHGADYNVARVQPVALKPFCSRCKNECVEAKSEPTTFGQLSVSNSHPIMAECFSCNQTLPAGFRFQCEGMVGETKCRQTATVLPQIEMAEGDACICGETGSRLVVRFDQCRHCLCLGVSSEDSCFSDCVRSAAERGAGGITRSGATGTYSVCCTHTREEQCRASLIHTVQTFRPVGRAEYARIKDFSMQVEVLRMGGVLCPCPGCFQEAFIPPACARDLECPGCHQTFCRRCNTSPAHPNLNCDQVQTATAQWMAWNREGRLAYRAQLAQRHHDVEIQTQERTAEFRRIAERFSELQADEAHKERTCKVCPQCGVAIERLSGCSSMVCGRNYHGGDNQHGCGATFDWNTAAPYRSALLAPPAPPPPPPAVLAPRGVPCSRCGTEIAGPLFRCINCEDYVVCMRCEDPCGQQDAPHPANHVFSISFEA